MHRNTIKFHLYAITVCMLFSSCNAFLDLPSKNLLRSSEPDPKTTQISIVTDENLEITPKAKIQFAEPNSINQSEYHPIQNKKIIFEYSDEGDHFQFDYLFDEQNVFKNYHIVLYDDGQMIIPGNQYKQVILSPKDIDRLLADLETIGFFSLESNQKHDQTDNLYNLGENYAKAFDGKYRCITVNINKAKKLCAYEPYFEYLVPSMKNIFQYLDNYKPANATPYIPDRIILSIGEGRDPNSGNTNAKAIVWDGKQPTFTESVIISNGDLANDLFSQFENTNEGKVFSQDGKEFTLYVFVILPHEKLADKP